MRRTSKLINLIVVKFLPGQWLDVHIPGLDKAGGFTVTSTPDDVLTSSESEQPYIELAIQRSPRNPAAAWLWRPEEEILGRDLNVRFGGSFTWPPPNLDLSAIKKVVLIAGGVGIK